MKVLVLVLVGAVGAPGERGGGRLHDDSFQLKLVGRLEMAVCLPFEHLSPTLSKHA